MTAPNLATTTKSTARHPRQVDRFELVDALQAETARLSAICFA